MDLFSKAYKGNTGILLLNLKKREERGVGEKDSEGEEEETFPTEDSKKSWQKEMRIQRNNKQEREI